MRASFSFMFFAFALTFLAAATTISKATPICRRTAVGSALTVEITEEMRAQCSIIAGHCSTGCRAVQVTVAPNVSTTAVFPPVSLYQHDLDTPEACAAVDFRFEHPDGKSWLKTQDVYFSMRCASSGSAGVAVRRLEASRPVFISLYNAKAPTATVAVSDIRGNYGDHRRFDRPYALSLCGANVSDCFDTRGGARPDVFEIEFGHLLAVHVGPWQLQDAGTDATSQARFGGISVKRVNLQCSIPDAAAVGTVDNMHMTAIFVSMRNALFSDDLIIDDNSVEALNCVHNALRLKAYSPYSTNSSTTMLESGKAVKIRRNTATLDIANEIHMAGDAMKIFEITVLAYMGDLLVLEDNALTGTQAQIRGIVIADTNDPSPQVTAFPSQANAGLNNNQINLQTLEIATGFYRAHIVANKMTATVTYGGFGVDLSISAHFWRLESNRIDITVKKLTILIWRRSGADEMLENTVSRSRVFGIGFPKPRLYARYAVPPSWQDAKVTADDADACAASFDFVSGATGQRHGFTPQPPSASLSCSTLCAKFNGNVIELRVLPERKGFVGALVGILYQAAAEVSLEKDGNAADKYTGAVCAKHLEARRNYILVASHEAAPSKTFNSAINFGGFVSSLGSAVIEENTIDITSSSLPGSGGTSAISITAGTMGTFPAAEAQLEGQAGSNRQFIEAFLKLQKLNLYSLVFTYIEQFGVDQVVGGFRAVIRNNKKLAVRVLPVHDDDGTPVAGHVGDGDAALVLRLAPTVEHLYVEVSGSIVFTDHRQAEVAATSVLLLDLAQPVHHSNKPSTATRVVRITDSHLRFSTVAGKTSTALMRTAAIVRLLTKTPAELAFHDGSRFGHFDLASSGSTFQFSIAPGTSVAAAATSFFALDENVSTTVPLRIAFVGNSSEKKTTLSVEGGEDTMLPSMKSNSKNPEMRLLPAFFNAIPAAAAAGTVIDVRAVNYSGLLARPSTINFLYLPRFLPWPAAVTANNFSCVENSNGGRFFPSELPLPPSIRDTGDGLLTTRCHFKAPCVFSFSSSSVDESHPSVNDGARLELSGVTPVMRRSWLYSGSGGKCENNTRSESATFSERPRCSTVDVIRARLLPMAIRDVPGVAGVAFRIEVTFAQDKDKKKARDAALDLNSSLFDDDDPTTISAAAAAAAGASGENSNSSSSSTSEKKEYGDPDGWTRFGPAVAPNSDYDEFDLHDAISVVSASSPSNFKIVKTRLRQRGLFLDVYVQPPDNAHRLYDDVGGILLFNESALLCAVVEPEAASAAGTAGATTNNKESWYTSKSQLLETEPMKFPRQFSFAPAPVVQTALGASAATTFLGMMVGGGGGIGMGLAARRFMFANRIFSCEQYGATEPLPAVDHPLQFAIGGSYAAGAVLGNFCIMVALMGVVFGLLWYKRKKWEADRREQFLQRTNQQSSKNKGRSSFASSAAAYDEIDLSAMRIAGPKAPFSPEMLCWAGFPDTLFVGCAMLLHGTLLGVALELGAVSQGTPGNSPARAVCLLLFCVPVVLWPPLYVLWKAMLPTDTFRSHRARAFPSHLLEKVQQIGEGEGEACKKCLKRFLVRTIHWQDRIKGSFFCETYASAFEELEQHRFLGLFAELLLTALSALLEGMPGQISGEGSPLCTAVGYIRILICGLSFVLALYCIYCIKLLNWFVVVVNVLGCASLVLQVAASYLTGPSSPTSGEPAAAPTGNANLAKIFLEVGELLVFIIFWLALFPLIWTGLQYMVDPGRKLRRITKCFRDMKLWKRERARRAKRRAQEKQLEEERKEQLAQQMALLSPTTMQETEEEDDDAAGHQRGGNGHHHHGGHHHHHHRDEQHQQEYPRDVNRRNDGEGRNHRSSRDHHHHNHQQRPSSSGYKKHRNDPTPSSRHEKGTPRVNLQQLIMSDDELFMQHRIQARNSETYKRAMQSLNKSSLTQPVPLAYSLSGTSLPSGLTRLPAAAVAAAAGADANQSPAPKRPATKDEIKADPML